MKKTTILISIVLVFINVINAQVAINKDGSQANGSSIFHVKGGVNTPNILLEPGQNGKVGIGTTAPTEVLDVNGKIAINNEQTIYNGDAIGTFPGTLIIGDGGNFMSYSGGWGAQCNTIIGISAGRNITTGQHNTACGNFSLNGITSGEYNSAFGSGTMPFNSIGNNNSAFGTMSLLNNLSGNNNAAFGFSALSYTNHGVDNAAFGTYSLEHNTSGNYNTAMGYGGLRNLTTGEYNIALGNKAGGGITTGNYNVIIGSQIWGLDTDLNNVIIIADGEGNQKIYVDSTGNVGINTTVPTARLSVNGDANKPGGGVWAVFSDERSKKNIQDYNKGLQELLQIRPVSFQYKEEFNWGDKTYVGLIAQEVEKVVPSMVSEKEIQGIKDFKEVDPNELIYMLINAIKEQEKRIQELENNQ